MNAYWGQWDYEELLSMQGVEPCVDDEEIELDSDELDEEEAFNERNTCKRCDDSGCNYCL